MIWVTWRQHRSEAITGIALIAALMIIGVLLSSPMRTQFHHDGLGGCLAPGAGGGCDTAISDFMNRFGGWVNQIVAMLLVLPGLIGVAVGAPLLAREFERGTWRMAWSQTVGRTRWFTTKLAVLCGGFVLVGAAMTAVFTWYRSPMDRLTGRFTYAAFDFEGLVPTAYLLCAFAFAVLAGLLLRRTIAAMTTAFVTWLALRLTIDFWLRPRFQQPVTLHVPPQTNVHYGPNVVPPMTGRIGDWILSASRSTVTYQPAGRFWDFQTIEAGIFIALTATALSTAVWLLNRRAG